MEQLIYNPVEIYDPKIKLHFYHPVKHLLWSCDSQLENYNYPQIKTNYRKYINLNYDKTIIMLERL
jgi:hypothetical protein